MGIAGGFDWSARSHGPIVEAMKPFAAVTLGCSALLIAGAAYYAVADTPAPAPEGSTTKVDPAFVGCAFEEGATLAYQLDSSVHAWAPDGTKLPAGDRLSAVLSARVVSSDSEQASLQISLSDVSLQQSLAQPGERVTSSLSGTFEIDVARSCRIEQFRMPQHWSDDESRLVVGALQSHEHIVASGTRWEAEQNDAMGRYQAAYTRSNQTVTRRKVMYFDDGLSAFDMTITVPKTSARATVGADGIQHSELQERVQIRVGTEVRADLEQHSKLERNDALFQAPALAGALVVFDPSVMAEGDDVGLPKAPEDAKEAWALYEKLGESLDPLSMSQARALAGLAAAYPEIADALVARLDGDELTEVGRSSVFWVLEMAGTEHAVNHLTSLLDAPRRNDRMRAAVALSTAAPTLATSQRLLEMYKADDDKTARSASLLALGAVGANGDEAVQVFARDHIAEAYAQAETRGERMTSLAAMGNAGDSEFMPQLSESLQDDDPVIRAKAAEAMRNMGDEARPHLQAAFEVENQPKTAKSVVRTLREIGPPKQDDLDWASQQMEDSSSAGVRAELIEWIAADESEASQTILAQRFHDEPSSHLKQLIGRHVPASELH